MSKVRINMNLFGFTWQMEPFYSVVIHGVLVQWLYLEEPFSSRFSQLHASCLGLSKYASAHTQTSIIRQFWPTGGPGLCLAKVAWSASMWSVCSILLTLKRGVVHSGTHNHYKSYNKALSWFSPTKEISLPLPSNLNLAAVCASDWKKKNMFSFICPHFGLILFKAGTCLFLLLWWNYLTQGLLPGKADYSLRPLLSVEGIKSWLMFGVFFSGWRYKGRSSTIPRRNRFCQRRVVRCGIGWAFREKWWSCGRHKV